MIFVKSPHPWAVLPANRRLFILEKIIEEIGKKFEVGDIIDDVDYIDTEKLIEIVKYLEPGSQDVDIDVQEACGSILNLIKQRRQFVEEEPGFVAVEIDEHGDEIKKLSHYESDLYDDEF